LRSGEVDVGVGVGRAVRAPLLTPMTAPSPVQLVERIEHERSSKRVCCRSAPPRGTVPLILARAKSP
jgi:hypothetical protein